MRSLSKLVKSSQIIIDKKKYVLSNDFFVPEPVTELDETSDLNDDLSPEEQRTSLEDELRQMKEEMLEAVKIEKDKLLSETYDERESIVQQAYDEAEQIRQSNKEQGYNEGFQEGLEKGYQELNQFIEDVLVEKEKYHRMQKDLLKNSQAEVTEVIIHTVEKILNKHIQEDQNLIEGLVEKALEKCGFTYNLTLRVSPEDYDHAISIRRYILSLTENVEHIEIKQDIGLKPGSCVFDTDAGSVDSSVTTQFENVRLKFLELLQSE